MSLIAPLNFLFAGLTGIIVLLYMLRLKRKEQVVSSTMLWQTALRDLQANTPWQRLRSSLLMWLQMLFLLLATLALMRPAIKVLARGGQTMAIIVDASGSMGATDVSPSRFEQARAEARRLIGSLSSSDQATIIAAAGQTRVLAPLSSDKGALQRGLASAALEDSSCNLRDAIVLASSLLRGKRHSQIYVISDGAVAPVNDLALGDAGLQFVRVGRRNDNLAVTALDIRRGYAAGSAYQIFASVSNFSNTPRDISLELTHDGDLMAVRPMTIPASHRQNGLLVPGEQSELFDAGNFQDGLFGVAFDVADDLKSDNVAWATLSPARTIRVLLVSDGNAFLERALNVDPNVQVMETTAAALATAKAKADYDVVVLDGPVKGNLPATNQLAFNTVTDLTPVTKAGVVAGPSVADWDRKDPVTRFEPWNDVKFSQSMAVSLKAWGRTLVEAERTPLVVAGERGSRRVVWCGFDLRDSDLPLRITFPIFITNALHWLTQPRGLLGSEGAPRRPGEPVLLTPPEGATQISIKGPDNSSRSVPVTVTPLPYDQANRAGIYTASAGSGKTAWQQKFAISMLSKFESNLEPQDALQVGANKPVAAEFYARSNKELWSYLALAALLLLAAEWWVYHRGV